MALNSQSTVIRERHKTPQPSTLGAADTQDPALHVPRLSWLASPRTGLQMQSTPRGKHFQLLQRRTKQKVKRPPQYYKSQQETNSPPDTSPSFFFSFFFAFDGASRSPAACKPFRLKEERRHLSLCSGTRAPPARHLSS